MPLEVISFMRFLFRLIPFLLGLLTGLAFFSLEFARSFWWLVFLIYPLVIFYGYFEILAQRFRERDLWYAAAAAILVGGSGLGFYLTLENRWGRLLIALTTTLLVGIFSEQFYRWFYAPARLPSYTLTVTVALLELFTVFFLSSLAISFRIFLRAPVWLIVPSYILILALLLVVGRWVKGETKKLLLPALIFGLLFGELLWAMLFLPSGFMVGGAMLTLLWYLAHGLFRVTEAGLSLRRSLPRYLVIGGILILILILTARWS